MATIKRSNIKMMEDSDAIEKFVNTQLELLKAEAEAEKKKNSVRQVVRACVRSWHEDEDIGFLVTFDCSPKEKLKQGECLMTAGKKSKRGIVVSVGKGTFTLSVKSPQSFPKGKAIDLFLLSAGNDLLQQAVANIQRSSVYKPGSPLFRLMKVLLGLKRARSEAARPVHNPRATRYRQVNNSCGDHKTDSDERAKGSGLFRQQHCS